MTSFSKQPTRRLTPVRHYLYFNGVTFVLLSSIYVVAKWWLEGQELPFRGFFPVLATCFFAFVAVSVFDAIFERVSFRNDRRRDSSSRDAPRGE